MIHLKIKELMVQKGIRPSYYKLLHAGIGRSAARSYYQGTAKTIKMDDIEKICLFFNCTPKEIFGVQQNEQAPIPETHALYSWIDAVVPFPVQLLQEMRPEELRKAHEMLWALVHEKTPQL